MLSSNEAWDVGSGGRSEGDVAGKGGSCDLWEKLKGYYLSKGIYWYCSC